MQFWNELEGRVVEGYALRRLVRPEGRTAWFETETGASRPAIISLTESLTDADEVTERLEGAQRLKHPNLLSIDKVGRTRIDGTLFVYAIMEHTDQDLSDVLRGRALSKDEARQVAEALVGALTAIHRENWVHGRVEPASVLAVGEAVKLRSDCLQALGGTRAGDVAGVGAILFHAFTQRKVSSADDAQINRIPAPFAEIVRNSFGSRWNLAQIAAVLKSPSAAVAAVPPAAAPSTTAPAPPPAPAAAIPAPAAASIAPPGIAQNTAPITSVRPPAAQPAAVEPAPLRQDEPTRRDEEDEKESRKPPLGLYAAVAVALLLLLSWLLFRPKAAPHTNAPGGTAASQSPAPQALAPARKPSADRLAPNQPQPASVAGAAGSGTRSAWRVIVYTYRRQDQAEQKVEEINREHPDLAASVFSPKEGSEPYLVILGGPMDRGGAFKMRDKALKTGLPADTYAQNFSK